MLLHIVNDFLNLLSDRSQIAVLGISINVKHRLDVIMADDDWSRDVLDRRQITEQLGLRTATARQSRDWRLIPQITERGLRTLASVIGVRSMSEVELIRCCGVWTTMG